MKYKVEKNIPIPPKQSGVRGGKFDFLDNMEIGDSFVVTGKNEVPRVFQAMRQRNMRLVQRMVKRGDDKTTQWRIWYVAPYDAKEAEQEEQPAPAKSGLFSAAR